MAMASIGLGPWFHKKIVDPLLQILRRYSLSISLKRFCLCFISSCFLFVGAGLLGVIESTFGGILLGLCFITHCYRSLIGIMRFPCLDFGQLFVNKHWVLDWNSLEIWKTNFPSFSMFGQWEIRRKERKIWFLFQSLNSSGCRDQLS